MANYNAVSRTNYFRVTDEEKYTNLFNNLVSEWDIEDFTEVKDGITYHGFGSYCPIDYLDENEEYDFDLFLTELQKILPEDEAFMYFEVGYEKLRYLVGYTYVVTKKEIRSMNIDDWAKDTAKEILGEGFSTRTDY